MLKIDFLLEPKIQKIINNSNLKKEKLYNKVNDPNFKYASNFGFQDLENIDIDNIYKKINNLPDFDILVSVGIGGSFLGLKASFEFLQAIKESKYELLFAGYDTSSDTYAKLFNKLKNRKYLINIVSKSGNTMETIIAYNLLVNMVKQDFPSDWQKRIITTTNKNGGYIYEQAIKNNLLSFIIPDNLGGRYSVISNVSFVPLAILGYDIKKILDGAKQAKNEFNTFPNDALDYAYTRYVLLKKKFTNELFATLASNLYYIGFWHQQLFAESEGKNNLGLLPIPILFSRDLHSLGQFIQEGTKNFFETFLITNKEKLPISREIKKEFNSFNPLQLNYIDQVISEATIKAHRKREINIIKITINKTPESLGYLFYFFEQSCLYSATLLQLNPFDQPGVELYKKNIMEILDK